MWMKDIYKLHNLIGEGTFGYVYLAIHKKSGEKRAIKRLKGSVDWDDLMPLREIQSLLGLSRHPNMVELYEIYWEHGDIYLVFEHVENGSLHDLLTARQQQLQSPWLEPNDLRTILQQILRGLDHLHSNHRIHRDIKPENILLQGETVKIADFTMTRGPGGRDPASSPMTQYVSTRWYRAPELLLGGTNYSYPVDMFGAGCIAAELLTFAPIFPGDHELDQLEKIFAVLGAPTPERWPEGAHLLSKYGVQIKASQIVDPQSSLAKLYPKAPSDVLNLVGGMLQLNPSTRATASQALTHSFFNTNAAVNGVAAAAAAATHAVASQTPVAMPAVSRVVSATPSHRHNHHIHQQPCGNPYENSNPTTQSVTKMSTFRSPRIVNPYQKTRA